MGGTLIDREGKKGEWWTAITVAIIGLLTAVVSAVLPWLLSTPAPPSDPTAVTQSSATLVSAVPPTDPSLPNLTLGAWTIVASEDAEGTDFSNSTLRFTAQNPTPNGLQLEGFFEWRGNGTLLGREYFRADLDRATRQLFIQGIFIESFVTPPVLGIGSFSATLSADARELEDGTWGSTPGNLPSVVGNWTARR